MPSFKPQIAALINGLFPDDGSVEWIFFNAFQQNSIAKYEKNKAEGTAAVSAHGSEMIEWFYNLFENEAKENMKNVTLGLGAWGTNYQNSAPAPWTADIPPKTVKPTSMKSKKRLKVGNIRESRRVYILIRWIALLRLIPTKSAGKVTLQVTTRSLRSPIPTSWFLPSKSTSKATFSHRMMEWL